MNGVNDTLLFLREIDTAEERLYKSRFIKFRYFRDLVSDEFKKFYKPSDKILIYIDSFLKADETNNMNKRSELSSKLKSIILLLSVRTILIDGDIL